MVLRIGNRCLNSIRRLPYPGNNKLAGQIPSEMGWLTEAKILDISNNTLSGEIPTKVGLMTLLRELNFSEY